MTAIRSSRLAVLVLATTLLCGCTRAYFWAINAHGPDIPAETAAYGAGADQTLDIYRASAGSAVPVVVFFYGGSWQTGRRQDYRFVATALASHGILAVVPDYRKSPAYAFPAFMQDAASAVAWTRANAARY